MRKLNFPILSVLLVLSLVSLSCQLVDRAISGVPVSPQGSPGQPFQIQPTQEEGVLPTRSAPAAPAGALKADSQPQANGLVLASPQDTADILQQKTKVQYTADPPENYPTEDYNTVGKTLSFTIKAGTKDAVFPWYSSWCATTPKILADNLTRMEEQLSINGQPVDINTVLQNDYTASDGQACHGYYLAVYGWPAGTTTLQEKIIFKTALNDGTSDYPAGTMTRIFAVSVEHAESFRGGN
jgi:hypothetical protein